MNTRVMGDDERSITRTGELPSTTHDHEGAAELVAGECVQGKYTVHGVLGHGGFAVVYDVEHLGLARRVALKVLHLRDDTPLALVERFRREARISALVRHPNLLEVYDTGTLPEGSPYLVMERVNGQNVSAHIAQGPLSVAMTVELGRQLAQGLCALADAGIVHRDIKPDNLMLHMPDDGHQLIKLVDFGISKRVSVEPEPRLTCHGALVGTPQYMAPEQIRGEEVDARTDVYAAGAVLYEALTGRAPHESTNFSELVVSVLNADVRPVRKLRPSCPPELEAVVHKALSRVRSDRYGSAQELLEALDEVACGYRLPTGAAAFRASDGPELLAISAARSSLPMVRRLWSLSYTKPRPLQLALIAMLVGAQGSATPDGAHIDRGSTPLVTQASAEAETAPSVGGVVASAAMAPALEAEPGIAQPDPEPELGVPQAEPLLPEPDSRQPSAALEPHGAPVQEPSLERASPAPQRAGTVRTQRAPRAAETESAAVTAAPAKAAVPASTSVAKEQQLKKPAGVSATEPAFASKSAAALAPAEPTRPSETKPDRAAWERAMSEALAAMVHGRLQLARERYAQAVRIAPREPAGHRGLGLVHARLGAHREAREALQRYLALAPNAQDRATISARIAALPAQ